MPKLPDATRMGAVHLTVASLEVSLLFYQNILGFKVHWREAGMVGLGAGGEDLLVLYGEPAAFPLMMGRTGLYHFAILVPSRLELAHILYRIANTNTAWQGAADHDVSEALYIADPDGNGIEIYRDRPREEWRYDDEGQLQMGTYRLDLKSVLSQLEAATEPWQGLDLATVMGHVHLHVRDIPEAQDFYCQLIGFDLMVAYGDSALFVSAGGYHHHLGLNIWAGIGAPPPPENTVGLKWFEVVLPDADAVAELQQRFIEADYPVQATSNGFRALDPSLNGIHFIYGK